MTPTKNREAARVARLVDDRIAEATGAGQYPMDLRALGFAAHRRAEHLAAAERELDAIADVLLAAGARANVTLASKLTRIPRTTLYRRMEQRSGAGS